MDNFDAMDFLDSCLELDNLGIDWEIEPHVQN